MPTTPMKGSIPGAASGLRGSFGVGASFTNPSNMDQGRLRLHSPEHRRVIGRLWNPQEALPFWLLFSPIHGNTRAESNGSTCGGSRREPPSSTINVGAVCGVGLPCRAELPKELTALFTEQVPGSSRFSEKGNISSRQTPQQRLRNSGTPEPVADFTADGSHS